MPDFCAISVANDFARGSGASKSRNPESRMFQSANRSSIAERGAASIQRHDRTTAPGGGHGEIAHSAAEIQHTSAQMRERDFLERV